MINPQKLKPRDVVKVVRDVPRLSVTAGEILYVVEVNFSPWDRAHYAMCKKPSGKMVEIMNDVDAFELLT